MAVANTKSLKRKAVNKAKSAKSFRQNSKKTHSHNVKIMRGGWRL